MQQNITDWSYNGVHGKHPQSYDDNDWFHNNESQLYGNYHQSRNDNHLPYDDDHKSYENNHQSYDYHWLYNDGQNLNHSASKVRLHEYPKLTETVVVITYC